MHRSSAAKFKFPTATSKSIVRMWIMWIVRFESNFNSNLGSTLDLLSTAILPFHDI